MQHVLFKSITILMLALTVAIDLSFASAPLTQPAPVQNSLSNASKAYNSTYINATDESIDAKAHSDRIVINISHIQAAKEDQVPEGPNCHHADTDGIIRFIVIDDERTKTRLLVHYFRLIQPNADLVVAAAAARAGANATGNDSTPGQMGDAAASLHMGNASLQLLGVSEYEYNPGLYAHDLAGYPETSASVLYDLLGTLTNEVPKSVRHISCVFYGIRPGRSGLVRDKIPSDVLIRMVYNGVLSAGFRIPGDSKIKLNTLLDSDIENANVWMAVNFLVGNLAIEPSIIDIANKNSEVPVKPNITTNMVMDINEMSTNVIFEDIAAGGGHGENATYNKVAQTKSYYSLGMQESVLLFVGYHREDDSLDSKNRTIHKAYTSTCLAANLITKFSFGPVSNMTLIGLGGGGDNCLTHAHMLVSYYTWVYPLDVSYADTAVYTSSRAYDLIKYIFDANLANASHSSTVCPTDSFPCDAYITTLDGVESAARKICQDPPRKGPEMYYCINLALFSAVLHHRLGLKHDTPIIGLGGQTSISWPLGMSLMLLQESLPHSSRHLDWLAKLNGTTGLHAFSNWICTMGAALLLHFVMKHETFLASKFIF